METLITYIENTFSGVPKTPEIQELKSKALTRMENHYNSLISEGKTENEAIGIIISEFNNISEQIRKTMNTNNNNNVPIAANYFPNNRLIKAVMNSYWFIVVAIYLSLSFLFNIWSFSWLIFIIACAFKKFCDTYYNI